MSGPRHKVGSVVRISQAHADVCRLCTTVGVIRRTDPRRRTVSVEFETAGGPRVVGFRAIDVERASQRQAALYMLGRP